MILRCNIKILQRFSPQTKQENNILFNMDVFAFFTYPILNLKGSDDLLFFYRNSSISEIDIPPLFKLSPHVYWLLT